MSLRRLLAGLERQLGSLWHNGQYLDDLLPICETETCIATYFQPQIATPIAPQIPFQTTRTSEYATSFHTLAIWTHRERNSKSKGRRSPKGPCNKTKRTLRKLPLARLNREDVLGAKYDVPLTFRSGLSLDFFRAVKSIELCLCLSQQPSSCTSFRHHYWEFVQQWLECVSPLVFASLQEEG